MSALAAVVVVFFALNIFGSSSLSNILDKNSSEVVFKVQWSAKSGESNDPLPSLIEDEDCEDCSMAVDYDDTMEDIDIPTDADLSNASLVASSQVSPALHKSSRKASAAAAAMVSKPSEPSYSSKTANKDNLTSTEINNMIRDQHRQSSISTNYGKNTSTQHSYNVKDSFGGRPNSQIKEYVAIWNSACQEPCQQRPGKQQSKIWKNVQAVSLKGCYNPWTGSLNEGFQVKFENERIYWSEGIDGKGKMPNSVPLKRIDENTGFSIVKWWKGSNGMFGIIDEHGKIIGKGTRNQFPVLVIRLFLNSLFEKKMRHTYYIYWSGEWRKVSTKNWKLPGWDEPEKIKKGEDWQIITQNQQTIIRSGDSEGSIESSGDSQGGGGSSGGGDSEGSNESSGHSPGGGGNSSWRELS